VLVRRVNKEPRSHSLPLLRPMDLLQFYDLHAGNLGRKGSEISEASQGGRDSRQEPNST